jgi:hypothetical protein
MRSEVRAMSEDYRARVRALSSLLYDSDPFVMGRSVSAPDDEYDPVAARLLPLLRRAESVEDCKRILENEGVSSEALAEAVWDVVRLP